MDPIVSIAWLFVIVFGATASLTLMGIIDSSILPRIKEPYLGKLFTALLIELVGTVIAVGTGYLQQALANPETVEEIRKELNAAEAKRLDLEHQLSLLPEIQEGANGSACSINSDCDSNQCYPGPHPDAEGSGKNYCVGFGEYRNCALPSFDGARYGSKIFMDGVELTCQNPGNRLKAQFIQ